MGGKIENKERKSVGLRREKQERGKKEKRKVKVLTQGDVQEGIQRRCSFFYRVEKRGVLKL